MESVNPCDWDSIKPCHECKKSICTSCTEKQSCYSCVMESEDTCFAFCDFDQDPILADVNINFPEKYGVIRCKKSRKENYDANYYPGFCKAHCNQFPTIQKAYLSLPESSKKVIQYMISSKVCDLLNFPTLLNSNSKSIIWDLFQLINSPLGYMSINPMYFALLFETFLDEQFLRQVIFKHHSEEEVARIENTIPTNDYTFLVSTFMKKDNFQWLLEENIELRVLNWNMLYYKISSMFMMCINPEYISSLPAFTEDWQEKWDSLAKQQLPKSIEIIALWDNFLFMMSFVAKIVNEVVLNRNKANGQPKTVENVVDTYAVLSRNITC